MTDVIIQSPSTGDRVIVSPTGSRGYSAYEVALAEGFVDTEEEWLESLVGPQGDQGAQGLQGVQGVQGATGAAWSISINPQSGATYTLALADSYVRMTNAGANVVTVPANATAAIPVGFQVLVYQAGAGATSIAAAGGVTINKTETLNLRKRYSSITLIKVATDEWDLLGDTAAP